MPLHVAAEFSNAVATKALLAAGAMMEARDTNGRTALHFATGLYGAKAMQALLSGGANLESRDREGRTPLHYAMSQGNAEGVGILLAAGAEPDPRDADGWTPLHYGAAGDTGKAELPWIVLAAPGGRGIVAGLNLSPSGAEAVSVLLAAGARVDARGYDGRTPLHVAAAQGNARTIVGVCSDSVLNPTLRTGSVGRRLLS